MKRVLVISTSDFSINGITNVILSYYRQVNKKDIVYEFLMSGLMDESIKQEMELNKTRIHQGPQRKKNPLGYWLALNKLIKTEKFNVIHIHGNSATITPEIILAYINKVEQIIVHSHNTKCNYPTIHKILKRYMNRFITDKIACSSEAGDWMFTHQYKVLKNGIRIQNYKYRDTVREVVRQKYGIENKFVIGHVGNFVEAKNHEFIIKTCTEYFKQDDNAVVLLVGDGPLRVQLEMQILELGVSDKIIMAGKVSNANEILQGMDVFLFPSIHEGAPLSIIEAQTSGLHVVMSSNVSRDANVSNRLSVLELHDDVKKWCNELEKCKKKNDRKIVYNDIKKSEYNVENTIRELKKIYKI